MQFREYLLWGTWLLGGQAVKCLRHPKRTVHDRISDRTGAYRLKIESLALQRGAGHRITQAEFGGDRAALAPKRGMPHGVINRHARRVQRGPDVGKI